MSLRLRMPAVQPQGAATRGGGRGAEGSRSCRAEPRGLARDQAPALRDPHPRTTLLVAHDEPPGPQLPVGRLASSGTRCPAALWSGDAGRTCGCDLLVPTGGCAPGAPGALRPSQRPPWGGGGRWAGPGPLVHSRRSFVLLSTVTYGTQTPGPP